MKILNSVRGRRAEKWRSRCCLQRRCRWRWSGGRPRPRKPSCGRPSVPHWQSVSSTRPTCMRARGCLQICQQSWRRAFMPAQPGALLQGPVSTSARKSRAIVQCATQIALLDRPARATTGRKASSMCTGAGIKMASSKQPVGSAGSLRLRSDQMMGFLFHQKRQRGKIPWRRTWRQRRRPATPTHQLRALLRAFP